MILFIRERILFIVTLVLSLGLMGGCSTHKIPAPMPTYTQTSNLPIVTQTAAIPTDIIYSPTPYPTLSAIEVRQMIKSLLDDNGDCNLPCILGLNNFGWTGQTIHPFFSKFGNLTTIDAETFSSPNQLMAIFSESDNLRIRLDLYLDPSKLDRMHLNTLAYYEVTDTEGIRHFENTFGNPSYNQLFKYYMLPQILTNYGPPTQVLLYVYTQDNDPMLVGVFRDIELILYYQQQDFWIEYYMPRESVGNNYVGCPMKVHIDLTTLLVSQQNIPFLDEIQDASVSISIKDATGMTVDEFYQSFKDPGNTACIETPMELWQIP